MFHKMTCEIPTFSGLRLELRKEGKKEIPMCKKEGVELTE